MIYDSDNYVEQNVDSYSPINLTHAPYTSYVIGNTKFASDKLVAPKTVSEVRSLLGFIGFLRGHISHFADVMHPNSTAGRDKERDRKSNSD